MRYLTDRFNRRAFFNNTNVDESAHGFAGLWLDFLELIARAGMKLLDVRDWFRADRRRRHWGIALVTAATVIAVGLTGLPSDTSGPIKSPPPDVAYFTYTVENGDNPGNLAEAFQTTVDEIVADNHGLFAANTQWCKARPVSQAYLEGRLPTGKKRAGEFYVLTQVGDEQIALGTLKVGNQLSIRCEHAPKDNLPTACSPNNIAGN